MNFVFWQLVIVWIFVGWLAGKFFSHSIGYFFTLVIVSFDKQRFLIWYNLFGNFFFFDGTGVQIQVLHHWATLPVLFFVWVIFEIVSCELFAWTDFEPQSSWSLPPESIAGVRNWYLAPCVNSCHFLSLWNPIWKVLAYGSILSVSPMCFCSSFSFCSYMKVFDPFWIDFCTVRDRNFVSFFYTVPLLRIWRL
jgi:hypothetical protein